MKNGTFISEMKILYKKKYIKSSLVYEIVEIEEEDYNNYCLTLRIDNNNAISGIYLKTETKIELNQTINCSFSLIKYDSETKVCITNFIFNEKNSNLINNNEDALDFRPEKLLDFFSSINCFEEYYKKEDIFIFSNFEENIIELSNPITLETYFMDIKYIKVNPILKRIILYI